MATVLIFCFLAGAWAIDRNAKIETDSAVSAWLGNGAEIAFENIDIFDAALRLGDVLKGICPHAVLCVEVFFVIAGAVVSELC